MRTYAERVCFQGDHLRILTITQTIVGRIANSWGNELRCHELARAVKIALGDQLVVVDGHCGPVDHSWLCFRDSAILDPYAPGRLPAVQLVDSLIGLGLYKAGTDRDDIRHGIVSRLVEEMSVEPRRHRPSLDEVIETVVRYFTVSSASLRSGRRERKLVAARGVAMFLARKHTLATLDEIARSFGGRHHTTVLHAARKIADQVDHDAGLRDQVTQIEQQLIG